MSPLSHAAACRSAEPQIVPQRALRTQHDRDKVAVKVLERRDVGGKLQFFVQEEGKPRGVLAYGVPPPPDKLPQVGDEIAVYRNNRDSAKPAVPVGQAGSPQDKSRRRSRRPATARTEVNHDPTQHPDLHRGNQPLQANLKALKKDLAEAKP